MLQGPTFPTRCLRGFARRARCRGVSRPMVLSLALAAAFAPCSLGQAQETGDTMVKEMAKDDMSKDMSKEMSKDMTKQAPATPREIIDRLIADPPAGAVAPQRRGAAAEPGSSAPVHGALDPGVVQIDPDAPLPRLRREGGFVVERSGRLVAVPDPSAAEQEASELWIFDFDRVPGVDDLRPMIVQKTQRLQMMQDVRPVASTPGAGAPGRGRLIGHFLVTGQVHTHRGVNYLLPSAVTARPDAATAALLESARARRPAAPATATDGGPRGVPAVTEDAFDSGGGTNASTFAGRDDPIRQMEALLSRPSGRARTPDDPNAGPVAEGINPDTAAGAPVPAAPRQEGDYLVTRRGRVIGGGDGGPVLFAFSADGANADDAPVVLMPCGLLADLEDQARTSNVAPEFALSGRIYAYRGVNHVLPTSYRTVPRRDNLGE